MQDPPLTAGQGPFPQLLSKRHSRSWVCEGAAPCPEVSLIHIHAMGEPEAPAPVEEPQVADGAVAVEISEGANGKGEGPAKPPKRLPKPNKEEMVAKANVLHETIKARKARIEEINSIISGKNRQSESPELVQLKNKLQALRAQWDAELVCLALLEPQFVTTCAAKVLAPFRACMLAVGLSAQCMSSGAARACFVVPTEQQAAPEGRAGKGVPSPEGAEGADQGHEGEDGVPQQRLED